MSVIKLEEELKRQEIDKVSTSITALILDLDDELGNTEIQASKALAKTIHKKLKHQYAIAGQTPCTQLVEIIMAHILAWGKGEADML